MAGIDRTTVYRGSGQVIYGGQTFWSKGDITMKLIQERFPIPTSSFGDVAERFKNRKYEVTFEPSGAFTDEQAAILFALAAKNVGASILGASDVPLVIHGRDGIKHTLHNAIVTKPPNILYAVDKTLLGSVTFTAVIAKSKDPTAADAYITTASASYPGDTGFAVANHYTSPPTAAWGASSPWAAILTEAGWNIAIDTSVEEKMVDGMGTYDLVLSNLKVSAKAAIVGPTVAQVITALNGDQAFGTDLSGDDLVIQSVTGAPLVTVSNAALVDSEGRWSNQNGRIGETTWIATRSITTGTPDPLITVAELAD